VSTPVKRLGKGLASMLAQPVAVAHTEQRPIDEPPVVDAMTAGRVLFVAAASIVSNTQQPRKVFDEVALARLAESIRVAGVLQPVLVRRKSGGDTFELVAGERRWRAAKVAGLERIPAIVADISDEQSAEWALIENIQREDLNAMERAWALRGLMDRFGMSAAQLAERVGLDRTTVTNFVRLTELEGQIQKLIEDQRISGGHGKALLMAPAGDDRVALARIAVEQKWSVRRTELEAARRTKPRSSSPPESGHRTAAVIDDLERRLSVHLGTKVHIHSHQGGTRGRVVIEYYDLDHFDSLMSKMGFQGS
jgi:ParB family transcriptional regulator, chromosome partitioning protein